MKVRKMFHSSSHLLLCTAATFSSLLLNCSAIELAITNRSFELPVVAEGVYAVGPPIGWTGSGIVGIMNPADDYFIGTTDSLPGSSPIDGLNVAFINYGGQMAYEDPTQVAQPNVAYRLTLLAGQRAGVSFGNGTVRLWAVTNLLAEGFPNLPAGTFLLF